MKARFFPINDNVFSGVFALIADALSHNGFAPSRMATLGTAPAVDPKPRIGFWERLDRWAWKQVQKEREAYLARSANLADLEERMRRLDSVRGRFY
jgi:hypothetical protein